jgi:NADPH:quinone reductase-like Zn-dependent oxidoreductase
VRKLAPQPGETVLVTSAASNTSLFALAALKGTGARVYACTSSRAFDHQIRAAGADELVHVGRNGDGFRHSERVKAISDEVGGFDCVVDPYFDLHLERAVTLMAPFGRYTTCGVLSQNPGVAAEAGLGRMEGELTVYHAMVRNLSIIGNCIGVRDDLARALDDYEAGRVECVVDSVFTGDDTAAFLDRTYNDRTRFGKVVFRYD